MLKENKSYFKAVAFHQIHPIKVENNLEQFISYSNR
jgi:hypothetical protein